MIRRLLTAAALLGAATALSACVVYSNDSAEDVVVRVGDRAAVAEAAPVGEALRSVRFDGEALVVRVDSNGCTSAADFSVSVTDGDPAEINLVREKPDLCRAIVAEGVELRWTYADLGLAAGTSARITNPLKL